MNTISIQDIINGEFNYSSFPAIAWSEFGDVYYVDAVGVGDDNNIYIASCYELLESMLQNDSFLVYSVTGLPNINGKQLHVDMTFYVEDN